MHVQRVAIPASGTESCPLLSEDGVPVVPSSVPPWKSSGCAAAPRSPTPTAPPTPSATAMTRPGRLPRHAERIPIYQLYQPISAKQGRRVRSSGLPADQERVRALVR